MDYTEQCQMAACVRTPTRSVLEPSVETTSGLARLHRACLFYAYDDFLFWDDSECFHDRVVKIAGTWGQSWTGKRPAPRWRWCFVKSRWCADFLSGQEHSARQSLELPTCFLTSDAEDPDAEFDGADRAQRESQRRRPSAPDGLSELLLRAGNSLFTSKRAHLVPSSQELSLNGKKQEPRRVKRQRWGAEAMPEGPRALIKGGCRVLAFWQTSFDQSLYAASWPWFLYL